jgi:hypothetical protein
MPPTAYIHHITLGLAELDGHWKPEASAACALQALRRRESDQGKHVLCERLYGGSERASYPDLPWLQLLQVHLPRVPRHAHLPHLRGACTT